MDTTPRASRPTAADETVPPAVRWFVRAFLAAFLLCAVIGLELWPLTGFRIFSQIRHDHAVFWVADTVAPDGTEQRLWFTDLPRAYQGFHLVMAGFSGLPPGKQQATCRAWLDEARRVEPRVAALHVYRVFWHALPRRGDRPAPLRRDLVYACS